MSSLKDIMDVDVEPLESQARRSREAAQQQRESSHNRSPMRESPKDDAKETPSVTRRRSNRVSKTSSQGSSSRPSLSRRRSSGTAESMESDGQSSHQTASSKQMSRGSNPPESIRYTPVTGRVSRAKKGQPVHVCDQCDPPRVFTRAEHLRRHALGHQKPAYPCTFEDCEKAFHRPDLLARHLNRHETQGEKAYKAGDAQSRSSSASSDSPPHFKVETPLIVEASMAAQLSPTPDATTARTTASTESGITVTSIVPNFQAVNFAGASNEQTTSQFDRVGLGTSGAGPVDMTSAPSPSMGHGTATFPTTPMHSLQDGATFMNLRSTSLGQIYPNQDPTSEIFPASSAAATLPLLTVQVPDQACPPGLSYTNSPWYSSDSTWSTPSEASHRYGNAWARDRSASVTTNAEWSNPSIAWSPQYGNAALQTPRTTGLEAVPENYQSPPYVAPHISPPSTSYPSVSVSSPAVGYQMELVGIPTFSGPCKSFAQSSSAPTARISKSELAGLDRRTHPLVDATDLSPTCFETSPVVWSDRMEEYIVSYRAHLEPVYAIIHPETFSHHPSDVVRNAVAALGSQFHSLPEDRENGSKLHEASTQIITRQSNWDLQTMQAIFLWEVFGRFRSQKIDVRLSSEFRKLYKMLVDDSITDSKSIFARLKFQEINASIKMDLQNQSESGSPIHRRQVLDRMWRQWIEWEVRQRLRAACFIFDVHQSLCYEQRRSQPRINAENTFLILPCQKPLWTATTSEQWYEHIQSLNCSAVRLSHPEEMTLVEISRLPLSSQADALASILVLLPPRDQAPISSMNPSSNAKLITTVVTLFPHFIHSNACLALYHSPLHQLLSLTGNTWLFGQKLTSHSDIDAIVPAIRLWASSAAAAQAAWHACHVLLLLLGKSRDVDKPFRGVSEYWFIYTCTLIVWAFGHRTANLTASGPSSAAMSRRGSSVTISGTDDPAEVRAAAQAWTEAMTKCEPEQLFNAQMRTETAPVIDAVRWKLKEEADISHGQSGMLLDACGVLDRIREGGKWF